MNSLQYQDPYKGSAQITREQFLFYEMRTTAKLMCEGLLDDEIIDIISEENLFQYPTEKTVKRAASTCLKRLHALDDMDLIRAIAEQDFTTAKQVCLYAMMRQYRIIWDFMITVIGNKYLQQDFSFSRSDVNAFFLRLQEQDDTVAGWSDVTIKKMGSVMMRMLIENEYITDGKSRTLNPVLITRTLENAIRGSGQEVALPAFNCLM